MPPPDDVQVTSRKQTTYARPRTTLLTMRAAAQNTTVQESELAGWRYRDLLLLSRQAVKRLDCRLSLELSA